MPQERFCQAAIFLEIEVHGLGVEEHRRAYFLSYAFSHRVGHDGESETESRRGTVGRDQPVEGYHLSVAVDSFRHQFLEAGIACGFLAVENAERSEHNGRRRTDGRDFAALSHSGVMKSTLS